MNLQPETVEAVQEAVRSLPRLMARGGGSKAALSTPADDTPVLELSRLRGVLEYEPGEFTFTALAGTKVAEVADMLVQHGQYLPFDPLFVDQGATLGGTVAAGTSGPGRYRFGGVRDFLIGVRFVDGEGNLVRGGGKVVKNAAGFDLPKLMVGSLGGLGVLTELSFKVFPRPAVYNTTAFHYTTFNAALEAMVDLTTAALDIDALDLEPAAAGVPATLWVRLGGLAEALPPRLERLHQRLTATSTTGNDVWTGHAERAAWDAIANASWVPGGSALVKVPLTPAAVPELDAALDAHAALRRYSVGGQVVWLAWPDDLAALDEILNTQGLAGLVVRGPAGYPLVGRRGDQIFGRRVKQALDPNGRFAAWQRGS